MSSLQVVIGYAKAKSNINEDPNTSVEECVKEACTDIKQYVNKIKTDLKQLSNVYRFLNLTLIEENINFDSVIKILEEYDFLINTIELLNSDALKGDILNDDNLWKVIYNAYGSLVSYCEKSTKWLTTEILDQSKLITILKNVLFNQNYYDNHLSERVLDLLTCVLSILFMISLFNIDILSKDNFIQSKLLEIYKAFNNDEFIKTISSIILFLIKNDFENVKWFVDEIIKHLNDCLLESNNCWCGITRREFLIVLNKVCEKNTSNAKLCSQNDLLVNNLINIIHESIERDEIDDKKFCLLILLNLIKSSMKRIKNEYGEILMEKLQTDNSDEAKEILKLLKKGNMKRFFCF